MKLHGNAALSWQGRRRLAMRVVEEGWTLSAAAAAAGVSVRCARKWVVRYRRKANAACTTAPRPRGLSRTARRSSGSRRSSSLRRLRFTRGRDRRDARDGALDRLGDPDPSGMGRLGRLGLEPAVRYERTRPGELVHVDVKKLGRIEGGAGWRVRGGHQHYNRTFTDATVTGARPSATSTCTSRSTTSAGSPTRRCSTDEKATTAVGFLRRAVAFYRRHGIQIERVLSDNGSCYRSTIHALACQRPRHPPPTNSSLPAANQRQSRTLHPHPPARLGLRRNLRSSHERTAALDGWLWHYNHRRRHSAIGHQPPATRTNLLGSYI